MENFGEEVVEILKKSPTTMHFVAEARNMLTESGYVELKEKDIWKDIPSRFFVVRDEVSIVAINKKDITKGIITSASANGSYLFPRPNHNSSAYGLDLINVNGSKAERLSTWADRDLTIAGKVLYESNGQVRSKLFECKNPIAIISSLCIHLSTQDDKVFLNGKNINPIISNSPDTPVKEGTSQIKEVIAECAEISVDDIIDYECNIIPQQQASILGIDKEIISAFNIRQVINPYCLIRSLIKSSNPEKGLICAYITDNNKPRASNASNFLSIVLKRIGCKEAFYQNSLLVDFNFLPSTFSSNPGISYMYRQGSAFSTEIEAIACLKRIFDSEEMPNVWTPPGVYERISANGVRIATDLGFPSINIAYQLISKGSSREHVIIGTLEKLISFTEKLMAKYNLLE